MKQQRSSILTIEEVSEYLRVPRSTVYRLAKNGKLGGVKVGRHWRFLEEQILNYLRPEKIRTYVA